MSGPPTLAVRVLPPVRVGRGAARVVERNAMVYRRTWTVLVSGVFEPLFYLLSIGVGIGALIATDLRGPDGNPVSYTAFVAPAMLAASAMNGAIFDSTFNVYFKLKYAKTYDAILATPVTVGELALGELVWALFRGMLYAVAFLGVVAVMGLVDSWWAIAAVPACTLIGFAFAAIGMAGTTYMRNWQDFEFVTLGTLPLFLFSATFYPLSTYPDWLELVVQATPLYHGVALLRALLLGGVGPGDLWHVAYLIVLGTLALGVAGRRLEKLLLR